MNNMELLDLYNQQTGSDKFSEHTDYTDYTDHMDYNSYNEDTNMYADVDVTDTVDQDWGGTHGFDGYPDHCVSHEDFD